MKNRIRTGEWLRRARRRLASLPPNDGLTLDETWNECMEMWRERVAQYLLTGVVLSKFKYLKDRGFSQLEGGCFFCEYNRKHGGGFSCMTCPGRLVDETFHCCNREYDWAENPVEFLAELERLNAIR